MTKHAKPTKPAERTGKEERGSFPPPGWHYPPGPWYYPKMTFPGTPSHDIHITSRGRTRKGGKNA